MKNSDHLLEKTNLKKAEILSFLEEENNVLKQELAEEKNRHLRTRADFDNFRKRTERDLKVNQQAIKKEILLELLVFLDYFAQALKQVKDPAAQEGLKIMARQFEDFLDRQGVEQVDCLGQPFNPEEQEGLGFVISAQCPEGCVAEEVCAGYRLDGTLLKPAKVLVAKKEILD